MHLSAEARAYKEQVAEMAALWNLDPCPDPVRVSLDWYRSRRAGDLDKRIGVCLDALQGVLFVNDNQIVELTARRFEDKANPRIVVTVEAAV